MKILITGGTGFLGSNLCETLLDLGHEIYCLDNNYTGSLKNIEQLKKNNMFHFIYQDIIEPITLNVDIDEIYHLACPASPPKYQKDPIYTAKICFLGAMNVLEFAKKKNAKVLLASTSEIYGEPLISPQHEEYRGNTNTLGIRSCYDEGKRIAETLFMDFNRFYNVNTRIIRIFNTYGPKMNKNDGRVVSNFINQALSNIDITIYGKGVQTRSFCYVTDLISGMIKCMASEYHLSINLGNTKEISILNIGKIIIELTKSNSKIIFKQLPEDDPTNRKPDITKARKILNWEPKIILRDGLLKTIEYFNTVKS